MPYAAVLTACLPIMFGQPGFFAPRPLREWFSPTMPTSYYSTAALKVTLERLVDFDRINNAEGIRISVGAANVRTGRFAYFDSAEIAIRPEHVMVVARRRPVFPRSRSTANTTGTAVSSPTRRCNTCWIIIRVAAA